MPTVCSLYFHWCTCRGVYDQVISNDMCVSGITRCSTVDVDESYLMYNVCLQTGNGIIDEDEFSHMVRNRSGPSLSLCAQFNMQKHSTTKRSDPPRRRLCLVAVAFRIDLGR